jgi:conjugative transposon TraN protein
MKNPLTNSFNIIYSSLMKTLIHFLFFGIVLFVTVYPSLAQQVQVSLENPTTVKPYPIAITCQKTTHLIFPASIRSVDRGTRDVLVQKTEGTENVLQVKAARPNFTETNLTVITEDGRLHSYRLCYAPDPAQLTFDMVSLSPDDSQRSVVLSGVADSPVRFSGQKVNPQELREEARRIVHAPRTVRGLKRGRHGIRLSVEGIYIHRDVLFCQLRLRNGSSIPYDVDFIRLSIRDRQGGKRTATQETEIQPVLVYGDSQRVEGMQEKGGGRHLSLRIRNRHLIRAWAMD